MSNDKITNTFKKGYQKINDSVGGSYKKIESSVVKTYTKIEDKFVDKYLKHDNETVEEAKQRLKNEEKERQKIQHEKISQENKERND